DLLDAFVVYLASHNRPMHELLAPARHDLKRSFKREFRGMTTEPTDIETLVGTREEMIAEINGRLSASHRQFLLGMKQGQPEWSLLPFANLADLPALKWKLHNIQKMQDIRRKVHLEKLRAVLGVKESG